MKLRILLAASFAVLVLVTAGCGGGYGGGGYGTRDRGPREMFSATCSSCGREAQVPFRPTSGKPVYCSDCFRSMRGA